MSRQANSCLTQETPIPWMRSRSRSAVPTRYQRNACTEYAGEFIKSGLTLGAGGMGVPSALTRVGVGREGSPGPLVAPGLAVAPGLVVPPGALVAPAGRATLVGSPFVA